ncbi:MAG: hypothetical protein WCG45_00225 [bacterium]
MKFKLINDTEKVLCPETFSPLEILTIKLSIPIEGNNNCRLNSEFIEEVENNLHKEIMLELESLIKKHIKNTHPYGQAIKIQVKKTMFEKFKNIFKHKKETNVSRD